MGDPDMGTVDRVAQAIRKRWIARHGTRPEVMPPWDYLPEGAKRPYREDARAAIAAMDDWPDSAGREGDGR